MKDAAETSKDMRVQGLASPSVAPNLARSKKLLRWIHLDDALIRIQDNDLR